MSPASEVAAMARAAGPRPCLLSGAGLSSAPFLRVCLGSGPVLWERELCRLSLPVDSFISARVQGPSFPSLVWVGEQVWGVGSEEQCSGPGKPGERRRGLRGGPGSPHVAVCLLGACGAAIPRQHRWGLAGVGGRPPSSFWCRWRPCLCLSLCADILLLASVPP